MVLVVRELVGAGPASECPYVMRRKFPKLATALSLVLCLAALATLAATPYGLDAVVYRGSFGWDHYSGFSVYLPGLHEVGLYEVHAYAGPVIFLSLPRSVLAAVAVVT